MLDVAIIGGGLCGLALAHSLQARGCDWRLFEARERMGGRVLTAKAGDGMPIDLGATWFWPGSQPAITRLVADLGLQSFEQLDDGRVLHLSDPNRAALTVALTDGLIPSDDPSAPATPGAVHGGARRVAGGAGAVIDALVRQLPSARLREGHRLDSLVDHGDFVELRLRFGDVPYSVNARRVVLALPPRVADASVRFEPDLDPEVRAVLQATPTWMATAAKAGFSYTRAFWRDAGHTGNAWVSHAQAMLAEVFDASQPGEGASAGAGLAGFSALGAAQRQSFHRGRDLLLESQMVMLFGPEAAGPGVAPRIVLAGLGARSRDLQSARPRLGRGSGRRPPEPRRPVAGRGALGRAPVLRWLGDCATERRVPRGRAGRRGTTAAPVAGRHSGHFVSTRSGQ